MFYFNMKAKSYQNRGLEYTAPFGLYTIISGSMEPNVEVYDVVIAVDQDISKIKVGDIITFISSWDINYGLTVTHRVVGISKNENGEYQLYTKGDNNQSADGGVVTQNNLIGKVVGRIPQLGRLQFFLATKMGWFVIVFIPALAIIVFDMIKILKLYVLKGQLDNVKSHREAKKDMVKKELESRNAPLGELQNKALVPRKKNDLLEITSLPKIDSDGIIRENTLELPVVKVSREYDNQLPYEEIDIKLSPDKNGKKIDIKLSTDNVNKEIDIPIVKKESKNNKEIKTIQIHKPLERRKLKKRK